MEEVRTTAPVWGASTMRPLPMYRPTWWMVLGARGLSAKKTRSPGGRLVGGTGRLGGRGGGVGGRAGGWGRLGGREKWRVRGPSAPQTWGEPSWARAPSTAWRAA